MVGEINDVAGDLPRMAHAAGAVACVDGVSYAPHGLPDVGALGADIYLFSTYKTYGPHQGSMVVRRALAEALPNQGHFFNAGVASKRLRRRPGPTMPRSPPAPASPTISRRCTRITSRGAGRAGGGEAARVHDLHARATRRGCCSRCSTASAAAGTSVRLLGPRDGRGPGADRGDACRTGRRRRWPRRWRRTASWPAAGDFYAVRLLRALGVDPAHGVLRLSFVHYTHPRRRSSGLIVALDAVL